MFFWLDIFILVSHIFFAFLIFLYTYTNLQWYGYRVSRVLFKHHKIHWHILYFLLPVVVYCFAYDYFVFYLYLIYAPALLIWYFRLDKKLVFTGRIIRALLIFSTLIAGGDVVCFLLFDCGFYPVIPPLIFTVVITSLLEKTLLVKYAKLAKEKLESMPKLRIVAITGSYGKTSMKNFIAHMLQDSFRVYSTPRSVNTFAGIVADINNNLKDDVEFYIVEAGAREVGNIKEIAELINHQYAVVGRIGPQHLEYFKSIENIRKTKLELLESSRIVKAYIYKDTEVNSSVYIEKFPGELVEKRANLEGLSFVMRLKEKHVEFSAPILGRFNIENIYLAIKIAFDMGVDIESIKKRVKTLEPIPHRLQKIESGGKLIIDDSFNGNIEGMLEGVRLASLYKGRKIIITPGLVESRDELNIQLAKEIDKVFDIAIITGSLNSKLLSSNITNTQKIVLKDKSNLQEILKAYSKEGDLILFANDAPNFI
ncbi:MAG: Mur ligase family protein [Campylobacterales bacterium]